MRRKHREIRFRHLIGIVRFRERQPQKERLVFHRVQPVHGRRSRTIGALHLDAKRSRIEIRPVLESRQIGIEGLFVVGPVLAPAAVMAEFEAVIHAIRIDMRMILAAERGLVALRPHQIIEIGLVERIFFVVIGPRMSRTGIATCQHADARRQTGRHRSIGPVEPGALPCQRIQKGRGIQRKAFAPGDICALLVGHNDDDIGPISHGLAFLSR